MGEELTHHFFCLFLCQVLPRLLVYLVSKLNAVVDHLLHSHGLSEFAILIAIDAVILVLSAVGTRSFVVIGQRHTATLAEFRFHCHFPSCSDGAVYKYRSAKFAAAQIGIRQSDHKVNHNLRYSTDYQYFLYFRESDTA